MNQALNKLSHYFPRALPKGMTEFHALCEELFEAYDIPNNETFRRAIATMIVHAGPGVHKVAPIHFVRGLKKAMADEIAHGYMSDLIKAQKEKIRKEQQNAESVQNGTV